MAKITGLEQLTGRFRGDTYINGKGGGGGPIEIIRTRYVPTFLDLCEVFLILGIADGGIRTPYDKIPSNVVPVEEIKTRIFDKKGHYLRCEITIGDFIE